LQVRVLVKVQIASEDKKRNQIKHLRGFSALTSLPAYGMLAIMIVGRFRSKDQDVQAEPHYRLGPLLHVWRLAAGQTQTSLAKGLKVAVTRVNAIERGRARGPGPQQVDDICALLDLDVDRADLLRAVGARDRALLAAARSGLSGLQLTFLAASLDAAVSLSADDLNLIRRALEEQVNTKERLRRLLGEPSFAGQSSPSRRQRGPNTRPGRAGHSTREPPRSQR